MLARIWYDAWMDATLDATADDPTRAALAWLLASDEPAVRHLARRDLLGDGDGAAADAARVLEGPKVTALLAGQRADGGFGVRPYSKWTGAHWRLVSLVELAAPAGEPRLQAAGWRLVACPRRQARLRPTRRGRLGPLGTQRDAHPQRSPGPEGSRPPFLTPAARVRTDRNDVRG